MLKIFRYIMLLLFLQSFSFIIAQSFKSQQTKYARVRQAYADKGESVKQLLRDNNIEVENLQVYLRAFKYEKKLELWAKNANDKEFKLVKSYLVCQTSGRLGPKRQEGDYQIPEGFYHIDAFNPWSNFYLSMRVNYPNKSDVILGVKEKIGGNICIHGDCVTIGCLPITDDEIKELYVFCIEAKASGQRKIPVTIFPAKLTDNNLAKLKEKYVNKDKIDLWMDLKVAYDLFKKEQRLPHVTFLENGRHSIK